jgi:CBS domain-containing protein
MSQLSSLIKNPKIVTLPPTATVLEAAKKMAEHLIGSIIVMEGEKLVGIFTERDILNRVVAKDLDPKTTKLAGVMSKNVKTVSIQQTVEACFKQMEETKCRHIPVVNDDKVVGIVTMRNILEWLTDEIKDENVFLRNYIQS